MNNNIHGHRGINWLQIQSYQFKDWDRGPCSKNSFKGHFTAWVCFASFSTAQTT